MTREDQIKQQLLSAFSPCDLTVLNESAQHHGHAGDDGSGESHWRVIIKAAQLDGLTRLQKHRAIHAAIGADLIAQIHALAIEVKA